MADLRLPDEVRALVQNHLASMPHLEALLLLSRSPGESLLADVVAAAIREDPETVSRALRDLTISALLAQEGEGALTRYRFAPGDKALRHAAEALSDMYERFPVQVIRAVYERPATAVQQLADAFRLRKT